MFNNKIRLLYVTARVPAGKDIEQDAGLHWGHRITRFFLFAAWFTQPGGEGTACGCAMQLRRNFGDSLHGRAAGDDLSQGLRIALHKSFNRVRQVPITAVLTSYFQYSIDDLATDLQQM